MSQIKTSSLLLAAALSLLVMVLSGCGDENSQATLDPITGKHPADWVATHWVDLQNTNLNNSTCTQCHGADLLGGISKVSCFSTAIGAQNCHAGGPGDGHGSEWAQPSQHGLLGAMATPAVSAGFAYCTKCHGFNFNNGNAVSCFSCHTTAPHPPKPWHGTTSTGSNHVFTDPGNAGQCAKCHLGGANLTTLPPPPAQPAGTAPGCFNNTLCHSSNHIAGWTDPTSANFQSNTAKAGTTSCTLCHGATLDGGTAPSCSSTDSSSGLKCHSSAKPIGVNITGCVSCHGNPPNGSSFPNVLGSHDKHGNIQVVTCNACHNGGGTGTSSHARGTVIFSLMTTFKAKTAAAFPIHNPDDGTCSNVSCHGGNKTPEWGSTNGLTCTQCHSAGTEYQVPEFNSYYSGFFAGPNGNVNLHNFHLDPSPFPVGSGISITCTNCHDTARLTKEQHFGGLAARVFVFPGNTVSGPNTRIGSYDPINKTCSSVSCHTRVPASSIHWNIFPD